MGEGYRLDRHVSAPTPGGGAVGEGYRLDRHVSTPTPGGGGAVGEGYRLDRHVSAPTPRRYDQNGGGATKIQKGRDLIRSTNFPTL